MMFDKCWAMLKDRWFWQLNNVLKEQLMTVFMMSFDSCEIEQPIFRFATWQNNQEEIESYLVIYFKVLGGEKGHSVASEKQNNRPKLTLSSVFKKYIHIHSKVLYFKNQDVLCYNNIYDMSFQLK